MIEIIRKKFEEISVPNFSQSSSVRKLNGEYLVPSIEDHWNTFQEGWEECMEYFKISTPKRGGKSMS